MSDKEGFPTREEIIARLDANRRERESIERLGPIIPIILTMGNKKLSREELDRILSPLDPNNETFGNALTVCGYGFEDGSWRDRTNPDREVPMTEVRRNVARLFIFWDGMGIERSRKPELQFLLGLTAVSMGRYLL